MFNKPNRLSRLTSACGLALLASLALVALAAPSSALAAGPKFNGGSPPLSFTSTGASVVVSESSGNVWSCSSSSGSGTWTTTSTGTGTLTFKGCAFGSGTCTSPGQPAGTIVTSTLGLQSVYLDKARTKYGTLFTPPASGVFAEIECGFGGIKIKKNWNGSLIGQITSPGLYQSSNQNTLVFDDITPGKQQYTQVEEGGPVYQLEGTAITNTQTVKYPYLITWCC